MRKFKRCIFENSHSRKCLKCVHADHVIDWITYTLSCRSPVDSIIDLISETLTQWSIMEKHQPISEVFCFHFLVFLKFLCFLAFCFHLYCTKRNSSMGFEVTKEPMSSTSAIKVQLPIIWASLLIDFSIHQ